MKETQIKRKRFLIALLDYESKSGTFNPHFRKKEMMDRLSLTEKEFNIVQKNLGDKYCYYVDSHDGGNRYAINVSECLSLQEQYEQEAINEKKHKQLVRLAVLVAILSAVLAVALSRWFSD